MDGTTTMGHCDVRPGFGRSTPALRPERARRPAVAILAVAVLLLLGVVGAAAPASADGPPSASFPVTADLSAVAGAPSAAVGAPAVLEAARFTVGPSAGAVVSDDSSPSGRAVLLWANGSAISTLLVPVPSTALVVRARGASCRGDAAMSVLVDGATIGSRTVPGSGWTDLTLTGTFASGPHRLEIRYTNDFLGAGCDRNLFIGSVAVPSGSDRPATPVTRSFGVSQNGGPYRGLSAALDTARSLGTQLDEFNFYMSWSYREAFPVDVLRQAAASGVLPSITWEPWDPSAGVNQPDYRLRAIASGALDGYIDQWARAAASFGGPVKIRFAHEMNGGWYPWAASTNGNSAADYRDAFRHVHDRFAAAGATRVIWVWSPNIVQGMPTGLDAVWPGASYVDAIGVDGYNGGTDESSMGGWRSPQQVFAPTLAELARIAPGVPVYIAETGSAEGGGSKAQWIADLFAYLPSTPVRSVDWFEFGGRADWRLTSSPAAAAAARTALASW